MGFQFEGLRTVVYKVPDLAAATAWYSEVFGKKPYFNEAFYVGFEIAGYELGLQPSLEGEFEVGNVLTYWGVDKIEEAYESFIAKGAVPHEVPTNVGGEIVVASVRDPWGNIIGLIYNPGFKLPGQGEK